MRDLELWRRLTAADDESPSEVAPLLQELAGLQMMHRAPFLGFVDRLLRHDRSDIRAAAVSVLGGALGVSGVARVVEMLDDDDPTVRERAVDALRVCVNSFPARWAHAVFHPRPDVRRYALQLDVPEKVAHYGAYLRCDPAVADLARTHPWPPNALPLVLHMLVREELDEAEAVPVLLSADPAELRSVMSRSVRRAYDRVRWVLAEAGRRPTIPAIDGFDLLDVWCRVAFASDARRKLLQRMTDALFTKHDPQLRQRFCVAALKHGADHGFAEDVLRLVCSCYPHAVLFAGLPRELRRAAIFGLYWNRQRIGTPLADIALALLDDGFAERPDGTVDLTIAAMLAGFYAVKRVPTLVHRFGEDALVEAARTQPEAWPVICELPEESGGGAAWFLKRLKHSPDYAPLLAIGLPIWHRWHAEAEAEASGRKNPDTKTLFTRILDGLDSATCGDVLVAVGRGPITGNPPLRPKTLERLVDQLEPKIKARDLPDVFVRLMPIAEPESTALAVLERLARRREAKAFAKAVKTLDALNLLRLLELCDGGLTLQRAKEHALAKALQDHAEPDVKDWAKRILEGFVRTESAAARPRATGIRHLTAKQKTAISDAPAPGLSDALEPALSCPAIGVAEALKDRPDPPGPNITVCLALIGSADPIAQTAEQLERWAGPDTAFRDRLTKAVVKHWEGQAGLPPLANAFLHRWERHGFALLQWLDSLRGGLAEALRAVLDVDGPYARLIMFEGLASAVLLRRYRQPARVTPFGTAEIVTLLVEQLDTDLGVFAARILVALHMHGAAKDHMGRLRPRVVELAADMSGDTLRELERWVKIDGLKARTMPARPHVARLRADLLLEIRNMKDLASLERLCAGGNPKVVHEATLRLIELGARGHARLVALLHRRPMISAAATIAESIPLWSDADSVAAAAKLVTDPEVEPELRFRIALALAEAGDASLVDQALLAVRQPSESLWLTARDWEMLRERSGDDRLTSVLLAGSPHPHAYQRAVKWLVEHGGDGDDVRAALTEFLEAGTERPVYLRRMAARRLLEMRDLTGLVVCLGHLLDREYKPYRWLYDRVDAGTLERVVDHILDATLLGGRHACHEERCHELTKSKALSVQARERAFRRMLLEGQDPMVRQKVVGALGFSFGREVKLEQVAHIFAWGVRRGRELTGRLFRVRMTERRQDFGYTRLNENTIFVSPLPVLRQDRHGRDIVEGLVLHEFGHHMYHRAPQAQKVWRRAHKEGIGSVLNLVADEHLERNLRAVDPTFGDRLKRLAAYAFQHSNREVKVDRLLNMLLASAAEALCERPLGVAFDEESVEVPGGALLRELDRRGHPFARFVRAMRMGLGNRSGDPLLQRALDLFKGNFRHNDMQALYEIALKLSEMYGGDTGLADTFGGHESLEWSEREGSIHGDGLADDDVQQEVERILNPRGRKDSGRPGRPGGKLQINVAGDADFDRIDRIEPVPPERDKHRAMALEVRRHSERLRNYLTELGLAMVPRRARLRGRAFDRTRARAVVLRRDPRMLVAREIEIHSDLFIGVVIDCSGSMSSGGSMDKAHRFGVLLAEACKDLHGVDARFFGFTDRVIFDAGDKRNCAVTSLRPTGGNNDAAGLYYAATTAAASARRSKLLVMISDGLPTECSVLALRNLVHQLTKRRGILCAQVAVRSLTEVCFPHYIELTEPELDRSVRRFGEIVSGLARRALGR